MSKKSLPRTPPHLGEFRDMDGWSEAIKGPRRDLQKVRELMMAARRSHRELNIEETANQASRLMEDLAVDQELCAAGRAAFDHKVQLPQSLGGGRALIAMIVREAHAASLMQNRNTVSKMSSERLTRVQACRRRAEQETLRGATAVPGEFVGVGTDVAMAFMERGNTRPTLYFGRVNTCYSTVRGKDEILNWPVSLIDAPDSLSLECTWFYLFGRASNNCYMLGIKDGALAPDTSRYPITAFVGVADMVEVIRRRKTMFQLNNNGQLKRFRDKSKNMGPVAVTTAHRALLRQQQVEREQGT